MYRMLHLLLLAGNILKNKTSPETPASDVIKGMLLPSDQDTRDVDICVLKLRVMCGKLVPPSQ